MGECGRQLSEVVGKATGALAAVWYTRGPSGWSTESWLAPGLHELLSASWEAPRLESREELVERILAERILVTSLEEGLGPLEQARRERVREKLRSAVFLRLASREAPALSILWLGLPVMPERERLEGLMELLERLAGEQPGPYQRIFDHVPAIFLAVDAAGNVQRCNAYLQRLGYQPTELVDRPVSELFAPGEWERLQLRLREREGQRFKALVRARSGELLAMDFLALPGGSPELLLILGCDLREERQIGHYRRLEAVDRLVSGVAHELNNPLQTVVGNAEMLAGMKLPESAHRRAQRALAGARRCQEVVDGLLKLKRTRHGFSDKVSVEEVVRGALKEVEAEFAPLNVAWRIQVAGEVPAVRGNSADLEQALEHVLRNAAQAVAQQQQPEVRITIEALGEAVQVSVQDNGPGMRPEVIERAFEPFFSTRGIGAGKGLGLSIALGIVQEHGGFIELQSTSAGTLVQFTLPVEGYRPY